MSLHTPHRSHRAGWLRAAVLGANDGIISTASLIIGFAAAQSSMHEVFLAGLASLVAGAMSMAAGEYVSVSSQADIESADLEQERVSLADNYDFELAELAAIYQGRGVSSELSTQVAEQLMEHDALGAHARDEIGIHDITRARPIQAALSSASMFIIGAALPLAAAWFSSQNDVLWTVALCSLLSLAVLGGLAARVGGASLLKGAFRVVFWGGAAMAITAFVGRLYGVS